MAPLCQSNLGGTKKHAGIYQSAYLADLPNYKYYARLAINGSSEKVFSAVTQKEVS